MDGIRLHVSCGNNGMLLSPERAHVLGRDAEAVLVIDSPLVSRRHVLLAWDPTIGDWVATDNSSRNGTFADGQRVAWVVIINPTTLVLGDPRDGATVRLTPVRDPNGPGPAAEAPQRDHRLRSIGRADECDIVLHDVLVSRRHAELRALDDGSWELVDLGSHNGTYVNGSRIERAALSPRDLVSIGQQTFRVGPDGLMAPEPTTVSFAAIGLQSKAKNGTTLLDDVSFALNECALLGVVGPSGAGKSTLLGALTGRRPAPTGTVWYGERDLYLEYEDLHRRIGLVPQDDVVHTDLTVADALEYAAELRFPPDVTRSERLAQVEIVMSELGLAHRRDVGIARLSGGERKRVSVAIELLTRPALLFLDEPTSGLDPGLERSVMEILRSLADGGRTVVVITHSVRSLGLCDRVLVLAPGGRTAYFGPPQLAPSHFGKDDFESVFQELSRPDGQDWKGRFRDHPDHDTFVAAPLAKRAVSPAAEHRPPPARLRAARGWLRQVRTLTRRYVAVMLGDRRNLVFLIAQAPIVGVLMWYALPSGQLSPPGDQPRLYSLSATVLFNLVLAATWLGATAGIREIVKEKAIFQRDRAAGVSPSAYLMSKLVVLGTIVTFQAVVVVAIGTARQGGPSDANVIGWGRGELMVAVALTGLAAMTTALVISAFVRTADMALTLLPLLLILQNLLAIGGVFPQIVDKPVLKELSYVSSSQWGFSAAASTADLNELQAATNVLRGLADVSDVTDLAEIREQILDSDTGERRFDHDPGVWLADVVALAGLALAGALATGLLLARREPRT